MRIVGIDPAWGYRNLDGLCFLEDRHFIKTLLLPGTETAREVLAFAPDRIALDAPIVVPNETGGRPADRLVASHFHAQKIACYPGNRKNCARILELVEELTTAGFTATPDPSSPKTLTEVYPHLTIVRLFDLPERLLYKKGRVAQKRIVFKKLQALIRSYLGEKQFTFSPQIEVLLSSPWTKGIEDQTDAVLCALNEHLHVSSRGRATTHLGCEKSGFIVYPLHPHDLAPS